MTAIALGAWPAAAASLAATTGNSDPAAEEADRAAVTRVLGGEREVFAEIVRRYQTPLYNLALRMLGDREEAADVAQDAFLRAYANLGRYDPGRPFRVWLYTIAANAARDRLRRTRPVGRLDPGDLPLPAEGADPEDLALRAEWRVELAAVLMRLGELDRLLLLLVYQHGLSLREAGQAAGLSEAAVRNRLFRARGRLRRELDGRGSARR